MPSATPWRRGEGGLCISIVTCNPGVGQLRACAGARTRLVADYGLRFAR